jgi:cytochrome c oxidase assembly factor CtaG
MFVQDTAFLVLIGMPVLAVWSWVMLARTRNDRSVARWRVWIALLGCIALTFALAVPPQVILFMLSWSRSLFETNHEH